MVGGIIESVYKFKDRTTLVVVGTLGEEKDRNALDVVATDLPLVAGDGIWWQERFAFWTPADKSREDVFIERIGYSRRVE